MRIKVLKKITWYTGAVLQAGRAVQIPDDQLEKVVSDYGEAVEAWPGWPKDSTKAQPEKPLKKRSAKK